MTLTRLLELDMQFLADDAAAGLALAERVWWERGEPASPRGLRDALEAILRVCAREGIYYPPILLRRKKELERGTWRPRPWLAAARPPAVGPASSRAQGSTCARCGGGGYVVHASGRSASLCPCGAWRRSPASEKPADPVRREGAR